MNKGKIKSWKADGKTWFKADVACPTCPETYQCVTDDKNKLNNPEPCMMCKMALRNVS